MTTHRRILFSLRPHLRSRYHDPFFVMRRNLSSSTLPYHLVVGMPALSPTMESGSLAEWYVGAGDAFTAGDALAKIETDKASIDFEAQDDGYVAKLLQTAGDGNDIKVGVPIMVTVEEEEDVAAFRDYVLPEGQSEAASKEAAAPPPAPLESPAAVLPPPPAAVAPPPPPALAPPPPPAVVASSPSAVSAVTPAWGSLVVTSSPLAKTLAAEQKAYVAQYGSTGQRPIPV